MIIKVRCPFCGAENPTVDRVLARLQAQNGLVTCRECKKQAPISEFTVVGGNSPFQPEARPVKQVQPEVKPTDSVGSFVPPQPPSSRGSVVPPPPPPVQVDEGRAVPPPPPVRAVGGSGAVVGAYSEPGRLRQPSTGQFFPLLRGVNVVGRKVVNDPHADIEVPCPTKATSRQHLMLVAREQNSQYSYFVSLYKAEVNETSIGGKTLRYGDTVELHPGDTIHLPDTDLVLEAPASDEATCLA